MNLKGLLTFLLATVASASYPKISAVFTPPTTGRLLHVRAVGAENKYQNTPLPIRNSRTAGANGQASVAGPCGGSNAYKAAGAPDVPVGSKVSLSLQYAAGHESANNVFTATFRCGAPNENQMTAGTAGTTTLTAAQCTTTQGGTVYPVPAPTGRDAKVVECTLPTKTTAELAGTGGQCTMSFQDQRDWGGCMDINYVAAAAPGPGDGQGGGGGQPPAAPAAPLPPATAVKSTSLTSIVTSGDPPLLACCGLTTHDLTATPGPKTAGGETTLIISGSVSGNQCVAGLNYPQNTISLTLNNVQLNGKVGALSFTKTVGAQVLLGGVPMDIDYISNVLTFTMNGDGNPRVCDTEFIMGAGPPAAGSPPNSQTGNTNQNSGVNGVNGNTNGQAPSASGGALSDVAVAFIVVAVVVVVGAVAVVVVIKNRKAAAGNGGLPTAAVAVKVVKAKNGGGGALKPGWSEAKDDTGAVYYFNKTTGETTWEKHLVAA